MTTREKVLVSLTVVAALGSGAMLLANPAREAKELPARTAQATDIMAELQSLAGRQPTGARQPVDLQAALESWADTDPFQRLPAQPAAKSDPQGTPPDETKPALAFTGYMEAGALRLAIINGLECQVGDLLSDGEHRVTSISRKAVILERTRDGERVTLPYTGDE